LPQPRRVCRIIVCAFNLIGFCVDVILTLDLQAVHLGLKSCTLQSQAPGSTARPGNFALGFPQYSKNVLPLGSIEALVVDRFRQRRLTAQFPQRNAQNFTLAQNYRTLH
jgi:hypothetical protein